MQLNDIIKSLNILIEDNSRDIKTKHIANSLLIHITNFKFICSVIIWHNIILSKIDAANKMLQRSGSNINESTKILNEIIKFLNDIRCSEAFNKYISDAQVLAAEINIPAFLQLFVIEQK